MTLTPEIHMPENTLIRLINKLEQRRDLSRKEWTQLIRGRTPKAAEYLFERSRAVRIRHYGYDV